MSTSLLFEPLTLPNGAVLKNRIAKAATEERLAAYGQIPDQRLQTLYHRWAQGGPGLQITGSVMVSPTALSKPTSVVLQKGADLLPFRKWAQAGQTNGAHFWMQINHPGRQMPALLGEETLSASAVALDVPRLSQKFSRPRALQHDQILKIIYQFATTAAMAEEAGFTGVQIQAADGYLLHQFLSPLTNLRHDRWGGTRANRARLLLEIIRAIKARVSRQFCISVKFNATDLQKGGFDLNNAKWLVQQLDDLSVDLVEISGAPYEKLTKQDCPEDGPIAEDRETCFVDVGREIAAIADVPIMVTGGIRSRANAENALQKISGIGVSMVGIARAMAFEPNLAINWQQDQTPEIEIPQVGWRNKRLAAWASMLLVSVQLERISKGKKPNKGGIPILTVIANQIKSKKRTKRYLEWRADQA